MVARPTELMTQLYDAPGLYSCERLYPLLDYIVYLERELAGEKAEVDDLSTELYRKIDNLSVSNKVLDNSNTKLARRLEMVKGIVLTLASTVEILSDSD